MVTNKLIGLSVAGLLVLCSASISRADIKLGKYVKVFKGKQGAKVALVMSKDKKTALVKVTGVEHELDGKTLLCEFKKWGRYVKGCSTPINGRSWGIFRTQTSRWGGERQIVWLPGMKKFDVYYDEKASKKVKGKALLAAYRRFKKSGKLAKLQAFKRKKEEANHNRDIKPAVVSIAKACGKKIPVTIDWSTVTDDNIKKYSIYSFCKDNVSAIRYLCNKKKAFKATMVKKVSRAVCRFGGKHKISIKGGTATFQIDFEKGNQSDFSRSILENAM